MRIYAFFREDNWPYSCDRTAVKVEDAETGAAPTKKRYSTPNMGGTADGEYNNDVEPAVKEPTHSGAQHQELLAMLKELKAEVAALRTTNNEHSKEVNDSK